MAKAEVIINKESCKSCELCIYACRQGVLAIDLTVLNQKGYSSVDAIYPDKCTGCCNCAVMCPESAITIIKI